MTAGAYDFTIERGATLVLPLLYTDADGAPIDLTGWSAAMHVRRTAEDADTLVSLSSAAGTIALGGAAGTITVTIDDSATSALDAGTAVYDLKVFDGAGEPHRLIQGAVSVSPEVTR